MLLERAQALLAALEREPVPPGLAAGPTRVRLHRQGAALLAEGALLLPAGGGSHASAATAAWARRLLAWAAAVRAARRGQAEA